MGTPRQTPHPQKTKRHRNRRLPPLARRRNRSDPPQRNRLPRRHSRPITARPRLPRHPASRRIPKIRSSSARDGHSAPLFDPPRPRRSHPPRRNEALHSRLEKSSPSRLTIAFVFRFSYRWPPAGVFDFCFSVAQAFLPAPQVTRRAVSA